MELEMSTNSTNNNNNNIVHTSNNNNNTISTNTINIGSNNNNNSSTISALSLPSIDSLYPSRARASSKRIESHCKIEVADVSSEIAKTEKDETPDILVVEESLERILDALGVPFQQRDEIKSLSRERKWQIVQMSRKALEKKQKKPESPSKKTKANSLTPEFFMTLLQTPKVITPNFFVSLRVCVSNEPQSWTQEFLSLGGFAAIVEFCDAIIRKLTKKDNDWKILYEFIKTLRILASDKNALPEILKNKAFLNNLVHCAFGQYSLPIVLRKSSSTAPTSAFSSTSTVPPLENRKATLDFLTFLTTANPPMGWLVVTNALQAMDYLESKKVEASSDPNSVESKPSQTTESSDVATSSGASETMFKTWMKEFEMVAVERARHWNGSVRKANDIFNALADGTYRWQPIVQAPPPPVHEKTVVDYMISNLSLVMSLFQTVPAGTAEERIQLRKQMNKYRLDKIYQRLRLCPNLELGRQLRAIIDLGTADDAAMNPPITDTPSKEGLASTSGTSNTNAPLPALPTIDTHPASLPPPSTNPNQNSELETPLTAETLWVQEQTATLFPDMENPITPSSPNSSSASVSSNELPATPSTTSSTHTASRSPSSDSIADDTTEGKVDADVKEEKVCTIQKKRVLRRCPPVQFGDVGASFFAVQSLEGKSGETDGEVREGSEAAAASAIENPFPPAAEDVN
ncbi:hypothetical protein HDU97_009158 [Phlyctochytrium planicorne]|nr:hypothetical protein HDU97_009158 [Phlyctochytrium planicorne]